MHKLRKLSTSVMAAVIATSTFTALTQAVQVTPAAAVTYLGSSLGPGASLVAGQCLISPGGAYQMCLQTDGNVVEYGAGRALWTAGTGGRGGTRLINQTDGNLVLYTPGWAPVWNTGSAGRGATALVTQGDGNIVAYAGGTAVWTTYTAGGVSRLASSSAVAYARAQLGKPYVYGAAGPNAFDCSGLTMAAYGAAGVGLPHNAAAQFGYGIPVSSGALIPGDLVFSYSGPGHVGIYWGNGMVYDSPNSQSVVRIDPVGMYGNFVGARRVA